MRLEERAVEAQAKAGRAALPAPHEVDRLVGVVVRVDATEPGVRLRGGIALAKRRTLLTQMDSPGSEAPVPEVAQDRIHAPDQGERIGGVGCGIVRVGEGPELAVDEVADVR